MKHPFEMKSQSSSTNESARVYGVLSVTYTVIGKLVKKIGILGVWTMAGPNFYIINNGKSWGIKI